MVSQLTEKSPAFLKPMSSRTSSPSLLEEVGLTGYREELSVRDRAGLARGGDLARPWLGRGGDQRFSGGWGIERRT